MPSHSGLPEQFGRYRILQKLGEGGMGAVYLAHDGQLGRKVALKVPHLTADDGPAIERFRREARLVASIDHPNLCAVHEVGEVDGVHYFTMPHVEGTPLSRLIRSDKPWSPRAAVELLRPVALALALLHEKGIIHRDLKPSNIMVRQSGEPVLMDFGLARTYGVQSRQLTRAGSPLGTPAYMSPEQVEGDGKAIGPAADVYGLGVILYELLTGQVPFEGPILAVFAQILNATPERPSAVWPGLDAAIDALCLKALAKKPAERFATMSAFAAALVRYACPVAAVADPKSVAPQSAAPPLLETAPTEGRRRIRPKKGSAAKGPPARRETESSSSEQTTVPLLGRGTAFRPCAARPSASFSTPATATTTSASASCCVGPRALRRVSAGRFTDRPGAPWPEYRPPVPVGLSHAGRSAKVSPRPRGRVGPAERPRGFSSSMSSAARTRPTPL